MHRLGKLRIAFLAIILTGCFGGGGGSSGVVVTSLDKSLDSNQNHSIDSSIVNSSYHGMVYKDIKLGFVKSLESQKLDAKLAYSYNF